jgi:hypothetical protein
VRLIRESLDRHYQGELAHLEDFNRRLIASVSISLPSYLCIYSRCQQIQNSSTDLGASTAEADAARSSRERLRSPLNQPRHGGSFRERSRSPPSQSTRLEHLTGLYGSRGSLYGSEYEVTTYGRLPLSGTTIAPFTTLEVSRSRCQDLTLSVPTATKQAPPQTFLLTLLLTPVPSALVLPSGTTTKRTAKRMCGDFPRNLTS